MPEGDVVHDIEDKLIVVLIECGNVMIEHKVQLALVTLHQKNPPTQHQLILYLTMFLHNLQ